MAEKLFGTLHTPLKPLNYTGLETDTILTNVDTEARTISSHLNANILNNINSNISRINSLTNDIIGLESELSDLREILDDKYKLLQSTIKELSSNLNADIRELQNDLSRLNSDLDNFEKSYATKDEVHTWIDDARIPQAELNSYAKIDYVDKEVDTLENLIDELHSDIAGTTLQLNTLEAKIGTLASDMTLKEEIADTYSTKVELKELQSAIDNTYIKPDTIDSYIEEYIDEITIIESKLK